MPDHCQFRKMCKGYREDAYTCHNEQEAQNYCGYYKKHLKFRLISEIDKLLGDCDFADVSKV
jgi:hypothetical protein